MFIYLAEYVWGPEEEPALQKVYVKEESAMIWMREECKGYNFEFSSTQDGEGVWKALSDSLYPQPIVWRLKVDDA